MALTEVRSHYPEITTDFKPRHLSVVPEHKDPPQDLGMVGLLQYTSARDIHFLSKTVMAADIALAAKRSIATRPANAFRDSQFQPAEVGEAFLRDPKRVSETIDRYNKWLGRKAPKTSEAEIKKSALDVFSYAQRMMVLEKESLLEIISRYKDSPDKDGVLKDESEIRRMANNLILEASGDRGLGYSKLEEFNLTEDLAYVPDFSKSKSDDWGPQDDLELDAAHTFSETLGVIIPYPATIYEANKKDPEAA